MNFLASLLASAVALSGSTPEDLGDRWGTAEVERDFYRIVRLPMPEGEVIEAGAFCSLPDGAIAVGTRRGDIWFIHGVDEERPEPRYHLFATGLDEIFGLALKDDALYVTQSCELTRITDTNDDGRADRFETISDAWGYANYHEYAFGSKFDEQGNLYVALGLSYSYHSRALFRGWAFQVTPEGESIPIASGMRSPGGIGFNATGDLFYIESQGPWNSSCSLKAVTPGAFLGHPISYNWYEYAPNLDGPPVEPKSGSRIAIERQRIEELVPYSVIFPYIRMGRSISGFTVDSTQGGFGPFEDQMFLGDYSLSIVMRATTERVNGVWQGACYPFREGLSTGLLNIEFTQEGNLLCGGTNRGWPVRGIEPYALERIDWTGKTPFEIERIEITQTGFDVIFTLPVDASVAAVPESYTLGTFTHRYHAGYGGPEVDRTVPTVTAARVSDDGTRVSLDVAGRKQGHVHEFDLDALRDRQGGKLVHRHAYYTVNEIPHPVPESPAYVTFSGGNGPGEGKHIVLIAADQEYRSEEALPMLAKVLAKRHGFDCTVLFAVNEEGLVDPTQKIRWQDESVMHHIPGIEHQESADLMVLFSRLITLPEDELKPIYDYLDSGKPVVAIRTANHGFIGFDYRKGGERVRFGEDVLGGSFRGHHGRWHQDSTRGVIVPEAAEHPILRGVSDVWGPSDVYRTYPEGEALPARCTPLLMGQPLMARSPEDPPNTDLIPLPVAWTTNWTGNAGKSARIFHSTMGSARDLESEGLRRLFVNAAYWCVGLEDAINGEASVEPLDAYAPRESGFHYDKLDVRPRPVSDYR